MQMEFQACGAQKLQTYVDFPCKFSLTLLLTCLDVIIELSYLFYIAAELEMAYQEEETALPQH